MTSTGWFECRFVRVHATDCLNSRGSGLNKLLNLRILSISQQIFDEWFIPVSHRFKGGLRKFASEYLPLLLFNLISAIVGIRHVLNRLKKLCLNLTDWVCSEVSEIRLHLTRLVPYYFLILLWVLLDVSIGSLISKIDICITMFCCQMPA